MQSLNLSLRMTGFASDESDAYAGDSSDNDNHGGQERKDEDAYEEKNGNSPDFQGMGLAAFSAAPSNTTDDFDGATSHKMDAWGDAAATPPIESLPPDAPDTPVTQTSRTLPSYDKSDVYFPSEEPEKPVSPQTPPDKNSGTKESTDFSWGSPTLTNYEEWEK